MLEYTISFGDIQEYLSTLANDALVGEPVHLEHCLVANTLRHKYPGLYVHVRFRNIGAAVNGRLVNFSDDVRLAADRFDALWPGWGEPDGVKGEPITVAVLRERMPELFTQEGETNA